MSETQRFSHVAVTVPRRYFEPKERGDLLADGRGPDRGFGVGAFFVEAQGLAEGRVGLLHGIKERPAQNSSVAKRVANLLPIGHSHAQ